MNDPEPKLRWRDNLLIFALLIGSLGLLLALAGAFVWVLPHPWGIIAGTLDFLIGWNLLVGHTCVETVISILGIAILTAIFFALAWAAKQLDPKPQRDRGAVGIQENERHRGSDLSHSIRPVGLRSPAGDERAALLLIGDQAA